MKLEEQYVLSKTKATSLADVRNLNLWGNGITDVSVRMHTKRVWVVSLYSRNVFLQVVARMPNVEVLSLSVNRRGDAKGKLTLNQS